MNITAHDDSSAAPELPLEVFTKRVDQVFQKYEPIVLAREQASEERKSKLLEEIKAARERGDAAQADLLHSKLFVCGHVEGRIRNNLKMVMETLVARSNRLGQKNLDITSFATKLVGDYNRDIVGNDWQVNYHKTNDIDERRNLTPEGAIHIEGYAIKSAERHVVFEIMVEALKEACDEIGARHLCEEALKQAQKRAATEQSI